MKGYQTIIVILSISILTSGCRGKKIRDEKPPVVTESSTATNPMEVFTPEELEEAFKTASLWEVGTNKDIVREARKKLIAAGETGLKFTLKKISTIQSLELRAIEEVVVAAGEKSVEPLLDCLKIEDLQTRKNAIYLLGILKASKATPQIKELLNEDNLTGIVLSTLGNLQANDAVEEIIPYATHKQEKIRIQAVVALGKIKNPVAISVLIKALDDHLASVRYPAQWALQAIGAPASDALLELISSSAGSIASLYAIEAVGKIRSPKAIEPLQKLLSHDDWAVRAYAASALGEIGDPEIVTHLMEVLSKEEHPFARGKIKAAIEKLSTTGN